MLAKVELLQGDITKIHADAIVNAANSGLLGGGGVDGAIHRAGGALIMEECIEIRNQQGGCPTGEAVITNAGNLPARFVIHTVGPIWDADAKERMDELLSSCYSNSLRLAHENHCKTLVFPNISTGVYCFPKERAARIAIKSVRESLLLYPGIEKVSFICHDSENFSIYQEILKEAS